MKGEEEKRRWSERRLSGWKAEQERLSLGALVRKEAGPGH